MLRDDAISIMMLLQILITIIFKASFLLFLTVSMSACIIFIIGSALIIRLSYHNKPPPIFNLPLASENVQPSSLSIDTPASLPIDALVSSIAGDNIFATQLDLARAYIETGNKTLAKKILTKVMKQGSEIQQKEAYDLLTQKLNCGHQ